MIFPPVPQRHVFRYVATGTEGTTFTVNLPTPRASTNYNVLLSSGGPTANSFKDARALVATFAIDSFDIQMDTAPQDGDVLMITIESTTSADVTGPANAIPVSSFTYVVDGLSVDFTDTSTDSDGTIASWSWDFGDGNTSTSQNPSHAYATADTYTVTLTVTDDGGASNSSNQNVTVELSPRMIVLAGQSNAVGKAATSSLTDPGYADIYPDTQLYRKVAVGAYTDPPTWTVTEGPVDLQPRTGSTQNMGPELSLGRELPEGSTLVQFGITGIGLASGWINPSYPTGQTQINTQFMDYVDAAGTPDCIVWIQGETDAGNSTDAAAYEANLTSVINTWRTRWPDIPIVIAHVSNNTTGLSYKGTVNTAQTNVWAANKSNIMIVEVDDLAMLDSLHYTADSYVALGARCGAAANQLTGVTNAAPVSAFEAHVVGPDVHFIDQSYDAGDTIASWSWDFGDGNTSTSQNPVHTYSVVGVPYTVELTVTDSHGASTLSSQSITPTAVPWTVDATLGWGLPATVGELDAALFSTTFPTGRTYSKDDFIIYNCQETGAVGDTTLQDAGTGGHHAVAFGSSLSYNQTLTGASRKFVMTFDAVNHGWSNTDAGLPDISTEGFTIALMVSKVANTTTNTARQIASIGTTSTNWIGGAASTRVASGVNSNATGTTDYGQIQAYTLGNGKTTGEGTTGTDMAHKIVPTNSIAPTGKQFNLGRGGVSCSTTHTGYILLYKGDMPPADRKALHLTLSVPATWTP